MKELGPGTLGSIKQGNAVLFLGAGASVGARNNDERILLGDDLKDRLADTFLNGVGRNWSLSKVAEYAADQTSWQKVQRYVAQQLEGYQPAPQHLKIADLRWKAIITTNYDQIIEKAYRENAKPTQRIERVIRNNDSYVQHLCDPSVVPYIKLHGCISCITDPDLRLVLANEDYMRFKTSRSNLAMNFQQLAKECTVIFVGYKLEDPHIQQILFDLSDSNVPRQRYVYVEPDLNDLEITYWRGKRFDVIKDTFFGFLEYLTKEISRSDVQLSKLLKRNTTALSRKIAGHQTPSTDLLWYLENGATFVDTQIARDGIATSAFYRGYSDDWSFLAANLDSRRSIVDSILKSVFLSSGSEQGVIVSALTGYAGAGTTVALKRIAWDAVKNHEKSVLYLSGQGLFRADLIEELADLINERLFVIVDDAPSHAETLTKSIRQFKLNGRNISFLLAGRTNEWNNHCETLDPFVDTALEIGDLRTREIIELIEKLEIHHCLGVLSDYTRDERIKIFEDSQAANRQLLIALFHATQGKNLAEIAHDEYNRIEPRKAQEIYADICTLNRFGAPVRAGLIARLSNIRIEEFRRNFIRPLEQVVIVESSARNADFTYRARHSQIAEWVFDIAFESPDRKISQLIRFLSCLNTDYITDRDTMEKMLRGKSLAGAFDDKRLVGRLYAAAIEANIRQSYIWHQRANYELNHSGTDFHAALGFINKSMALEQKNTLAQRHTKARILRSLAKQERNQLQKQRYREDIFELLSAHMQKSKDTRPYSLLIDTLIDQMDEIMQESGNEEAIASLVSRIQRHFLEGFQRFSDDPYLLTTQARFSEKLDDTPKSLEILKKAFLKDRSNSFIAIRLARRLIANSDITGANSIIRECLSENPTDKHLNLEMAKTLMLNPAADIDTLHQYLNRSFTKGDSHHEARFIAARHFFVNSQEGRATELFRELKSGSFSMEQKRFIRSRQKDPNNRELAIFSGRIHTIYDAYAFVHCRMFSQDIHMRIVDSDKSDDSFKLQQGQDVTFNLGFCYLGPEAINVKPTL